MNSNFAILLPQNWKTAILTISVAQNSYLGKLCLEKFAKTPKTQNWGPLKLLEMA